MIVALLHQGQIGQLKVGELRAALMYRAVAFDVKLLKPQLRELLENAMNLPTAGDPPRLVIAAEAAAQPAVAGGSGDPVDATVVHDDTDDSDDSESSGDDDEEEGVDPTD